MSDNKPVLNHRELEIKRIEKSIEKIHDDLVTKKENSQLPEQLFIDNFLPYFSGELEIKKNPKVVETWIAIAGSPVAEVDLIDENKEVVITVPPYFTSDLINLHNTDNKKSLSDAYHEYNALNAGLPAVAENFITKEYEKISNKLKVPLVSAWDKVFIKYLPSEVTEEVNKENKKHNNDETEFG